ncbi:MAG: hypothetical protein ACKO7N_09275, partial [Candidatus Nitrosotenuis sp.]
AGDAYTNGGDIKIYAGDADSNGGYINIDAGNGYDQGGDVSISAGNSTISGGDITLTAGSPSGIIKLNSPIIYFPVVISLNFDTTINTNCSSGEIFDITLTDNILLANPTNPVDGKTLRWRIVQDNSGNRSVTLGDKFVIPSGATSPLPWSTSGDKMDILAATYHEGRDKWDVVAFVPGY